MVPFTSQYHPLAKASHDTVKGLERFDVSGRTDAYQSLLNDLWSYGEPFCIIEHDIEINDRAVRQARHCSCSWGTSPYIGPGNEDMLTKSLGFARFGKELLEAIPNFINDVAQVDDGKDVAPGHWRRLDVRISAALANHGYVEPHLHEPVIQHHVYGGVCSCKQEHEGFSVDVEGRFKP